MEKLLPGNANMFPEGSLTQAEQVPNCLITSEDTFMKPRCVGTIKTTTGHFLDILIKSYFRMGKIVLEVYIHTVAVEED